jgi:Protein of unknown function (DUF3455)/Sigma-70 region 2
VTDLIREEEWASLMRAALAGDAIAYRQFLLSVTSHLRAIAHFYQRSLGAGEGGVEDVVQEVLLAVHLKSGTWDTSRPIVPWLATIVRNKLIDTLRPRERHTARKRRPTPNRTGSQHHQTERDQPVRWFIVGFAIALLVCSSAFAAAQSMPAKLAVPGGSLVGKYAAKGVQIYVCRVKDTANEWAFKAPEAELINGQGRVFAKHYAGPTWEAPDGSKIVGKTLASEPARKPGAIPWLLLSTESSGSGVLAGVRFVQRVNTSGGVGPTGTCPTVGAEQRVDYTADYIFYK